MTRRRLTPEERALWRRVASAVRPLSHTPSETTPQGQAKAGAPIGDKKVKATGVAPRKKTHRPIGPLTKKRVSHVDPFNAGDPKTERHVRRGRKEIDAVFDLHGHTQSSARGALFNFLNEACARQYKCVLIITGKGVRLDGSAHGVGSGVLRARFRDWVREPDFRQFITRVSPAHSRHGGGGAFYVFLKRNKRRPGSE